MPQPQLGTRLQNASRLMRQHQQQLTPRRPPASSSSNASRALQTARALLYGGATLGVGATVRSWWAVAHCEGNRLSGMLHQQLDTEQLEQDQNFDWRRFWSYLEPHTWELIGAIFVSSAP